MTPSKDAVEEIRKMFRIGCGAKFRDFDGNMQTRGEIDCGKNGYCSDCDIKNRLMQQTVEKIKEEIDEVIQKRWYWWQNFLTDAGANDYEANKLAHGCQEDLEKIKEDIKGLFTKFGVSEKKDTSFLIKESTISENKEVGSSENTSEQNKEGEK